MSSTAVTEAREERVPGAERSLPQLAELLYLLVRKELTARYKSRFLGYLWALANPFAFAFVYWIAFKFIMRLEIENYSLFLVTGLFPWVWLSTGVTQATRSYFVNASLIKKARLPRFILPLANVAQEMAHFAFALPVIFALLWFAGAMPPRASWLWQVPLLLALQTAFAYPLALSLALANVYVRDIEYLVGIGFSLLFFATPMVYPVTLVPEAYRHWFELNPLHAMMHSWRTVFLEGTLDPGQVAYAAAFAAVSGLVAWLIYRKLAPRVGELL
jgi:lipopolysaccharide transport system permease protein